MKDELGLLTTHSPISVQAGVCSLKPWAWGQQGACWSWVSCWGVLQGTRSGTWSLRVPSSLRSVILIYGFAALVNDLGTAIWFGQITSKQRKHWRKLLLTVHKKNCCSVFTALSSQHNGLPYSALKGWDAGCSVLLWEADSLKLCIKLFAS